MSNIEASDAIEISEFQPSAKRRPAAPTLRDTDLPTAVVALPSSREWTNALASRQVDPDRTGVASCQARTTDSRECRRHACRMDRRTRGTLGDTPEDKRGTPVGSASRATRGDRKGLRSGPRPTFVQRAQRPFHTIVAGIFGQTHLLYPPGSRRCLLHVVEDFFTAV